MLSIYAAGLLDLILGDPYWFPHPVRFIGKYISLFEKQIRKKVVSSKGLKIAGMMLVVSTILLTFLIAYGILKGAKLLHPILYYILNIILLWTCLAARCLQKETLKVYHALKDKSITKARRLLSYLVGRDTETLNEQEITKAAVETVAENTSDGIIAPLFYMFIGGAPLALAYKAINTMDSMVGYKNDKYRDFGWAAAKLDDLVNYIPARLTGLCLSLVSFLLGLNTIRSFKILGRDGRNHSSPNSGFPEAAVAGALGVQLGGTSIYFGKSVYKPTIGDSERPMGNEDIIKTHQLMYGCTVLVYIIMTALIQLKELI